MGVATARALLGLDERFVRGDALDLRLEVDDRAEIGARGKLA
jgi:hypothetical protein